MYKDVKSCVLSNGCKSPHLKCNIGVRQGDHLSPILFSIFINDLEQFLIEKGNCYININDNNFSNYLKLLTIMYADDNVILANNATDLQKLLNGLF